MHHLESTQREEGTCISVVTNDDDQSCLAELKATEGGHHSSHGNRETNFAMTHPSISVDIKPFHVSLPSNCGREEVIVGCATLQVLKLFHYMHISKYLRTYIIPAHSHHPSTHITQHLHNPNTHIIPAHI